MTTFLLAAIFTTGAVAIVEGVVLFGRAQLLLQQAEEILARLEPPLLPAESFPEVLQDPEPEVSTDEIPAIERPAPTPGPRTQPSEVAAVVAVTADDWLQKWRQDTDAELAEMRERWDREAA